MSSLGTSKGILEIAKFGVYVTVPVVLMYAFANNTKNLQKFMGNDLVEMEAFEFRLEDKRFPRQQLEMEVIISTRLWMLHTIPKALSEQNPETEVHKEGGEKRRADPRGNFVEGPQLKVDSNSEDPRPREKGSASLSVKCLINVSNQVTGSEIRVQVASLRPINAEKTICSCKKANDMVRYPAFSDDKGILGLIYDTLLRARALP
ncbi:hypothetical protein D5086_019605 [Populus alba]|uniref:Uncharacterized protein n=1 Tax=Populus alba TaxID=43335 RepID=A0ACC4BIC4_POPAL